jgi:GNAT superfamily N-acetyltransferase
MTNLQIEIISEWPDALLEKLSCFYAERPERDGWSAWGERWDWSQEYFRWKCADNPVRSSIAAIVFDGDRIAGCAIITFKRMHHHDTDLLVGELGDIYIYPSYRGRGLFRDLVDKAVKGARAAGATLVYCVPNSNAFDALIATGHFAHLAGADHATWLLPLRPVALLAASRPWLKFFAWADFFARAWAKLVNPSQAGRLEPRDLPQTDLPQNPFELRVSFPAALLEYRLFGGPRRGSYSVLSLNTAPVQSTVLRHVPYHGREALFVGRCFVARAEDYGRLISRIVRLSLTGNYCFVALWAPRSAPYSSALWRRGFVPMQRKRIAVDIDAHARFDRAILSRIYLEMLDSDKV